MTGFPDDPTERGRPSAGPVKLSHYRPMSDTSTWDIFVCPTCRQPVRVNYEVLPDPTDPLGSIIEGHVEDIHCCDEP